MGQNPILSEVLLNPKDGKNFDSPVKTTQNMVQEKQHWCKAKMSTELKAKLEEQKELKKEVNKLEYEVLQSERVQDNIDKLREKLRNF